MKSIATLISALLFSGMLMAQGNCSEADQAWMAENQELLTALTQTCGFECVSAEDQNLCVEECMTENTELSASCVSCFVEQVTCISANCLFICVSGSETECAECIAAYCLDDFYTCTGISDEDQDGYNNLIDCDDTDENINPEAEEIWYDGTDQNCDGLSDYDQDMDGEDSAEYGGTDCDDLNPDQTGGQTFYYMDADMDGYGKTTTGFWSCVVPPDTTTVYGDCDDTNPEIYPGAPGTADGVDNNCDGVIDSEEAFVCEGDFDLNGVISVSDLLPILARLGCTVCDAYDLNLDGIVNTDEVLIILGSLGNECEP